MGSSENLIQNECLVWLNQNGFWAIRLKNVGTYDVAKESFRKLGKFEVKGVPDAVAFGDNARTIWIEFKTLKGVQSAEQKSFEAQLKRRGHTYLLVRSLEELKQCLVNIGTNISTNSGCMGP